MTSLGAWVRSLTGWRRLLFAFAMGAVSATGFAPLSFFPALLIGYAALVLLIDGADVSARPVRGAAAVGWAFLFGQFLIGLHWIGFAFMVDPSNHLWQMPFAVIGLAAALGLFGALAGGLAAYFWQDGPARLFIFAVMFALGEWLRGHILTGFPWNLSAYGWGWSLALLQSASLMGSYGLSFLTIMLGASLAEFCAARWRTPAALLLLFAMLWGYGAWRLADAPKGDTGVVVRLVQPAIPQPEKYVRALLPRNWRRLMTLSVAADNPAIGHPGIIVWPEAATGFPVARAPGALDQIGLLTARGQSLLTGSDRIDAGPNGRAFYNTLYAFPAGGALPLVYDKFHLVPFGEYVPFASALLHIGISQLVVGEGFTSGDHPHVLNVPGAPAFTPLICYEVIFPHDVIDSAETRPGWLVNITDDSWFGPWAGPRQHLLIARMRAIEEGLPIARAANTGISAMIDGNGQIRAMLTLGKQGVVDARLPAALAPPPYARFGDLIFLFLLVGAAVAAWCLSPRFTRG